MHLLTKKKHNNPKDKNDIFDYCSEIWRVSNEKNRVAVIVANAKLNKLSTYEFMAKVVG